MLDHRPLLLLTFFSSLFSSVPSSCRFIATLPSLATIVIKLVWKLRKAQGVHVSHIRGELKSADSKEQKWTKKKKPSKCFQAPVMFVREMLIVHM